MRQGAADAVEVEIVGQIGALDLAGQAAAWAGRCGNALDVGSISLLWRAGQDDHRFEEQLAQHLLGEHGKGGRILQHVVEQAYLGRVIQRVA